jgi:cytoskeletal protein RodZ
MPPVNDQDGRQDWHDHPGVIWAAGVAALALVGLLVYAVIRVSGGSTLLPGDAPPAASYATTSSTSTGTSTTTSYTVPSVQTSEDTGAPVTSPPDASTEDQSGPTDMTTSTTIYNPYSSTTPTNAGHV